MGQLSSGNGELEILSAKVSQALDRLDKISKMLQELQSEQESLTEWVRGLEHVIKELSRARENNSSDKPTASGGITNKIKKCNVYFSSIGHSANTPNR